MTLPPIVLAVIARRSVRFENQKVGDDPIRGVHFSTSEVDLLELVLGMTHPETGWLTQHPALAATLTPLDSTVPRQFDTLFGQQLGEDGGRLVSERRVAAAKDDWGAHCASAHRLYSQIHSRLLEVARISRDPAEPIQGLIDDPRPLDAYLGMVLGLRSQRRCRVSNVRHHQLDVRNELLARLPIVLGFRPKSTRELTFTGKQDGRLFRAGNTWRVRVPFEEFKNYRHCRLFGDDGRHHDFETELDDHAGLYDLLEKYLYDVLPRMPKPGRSDRIFLTSAGREFDPCTHWEVMRGLSAFHFAWNPVKRTGLPGVSNVNPYAHRHIIATHVLRNSKGRNPIEEAAFALQTSESMIIKNYALLCAEENLIGYRTTLAMSTANALARAGR